ncbi:MAG: NAD-glutamate dehydrogenase [Pseudohongiellaceae bacterium]
MAITRQRKTSVANSVLLAPLYKKIQSRHGKRKAETLTLFARRLFASSAHTELALLPIGQIYNEVLAAWNFFQQRPAIAPKIRFSNPYSSARTAGSHGTVIHLLADDMPFLVDSVSQELNNRNIGIEAVYNAVYHVERQRRGKGGGDLKKLGLVKQEVNQAEALLCFHTSWLSPEECELLEQALLDVLHHVDAAVQDFVPMCARAVSLRETLLHAKTPVTRDELQESCAFIAWLVENHFTFLGYEKYSITRSGKSTYLSLDKRSLLGISKLKTGLRSRVQLKDVADDAGELILRKQICSFAKSAVRSKVHRPGFYDYVLIKEFNSQGEVAVEHRFLGLYTSSVYFQMASDIPLLRKKIRYVLDRSGFTPNGHSIKGLYQVINALPRDELFQLTNQQLFDLAMQISQIHERRRVRLFIRRDNYGKYISALVYIPKDIYTTRVRLEMQQFLLRELQAVELDFSAYYPESILARLHFILRVPNISKLTFDPVELEMRLVQLVKPWDDELLDQLQATHSDQFTRYLFNQFAGYFPLTYKEEYSAAEAVRDIPHMQEVIRTRGLSLEFEAINDGAEFNFGFKVFRYGAQLVLSDVIPVIEHMGLMVLREQGYCLHRQGETEIWLHDFSLSSKSVLKLDVETAREHFEEAFEAVWQGRTEDDTYNALVLGSQLPWREVALLRAYGAYMKQIQAGYSQHFIAETLRANGKITTKLVRYFKTQFDPQFTAGTAARQKKALRLEQSILRAVDNVINLAEDNVLRLYLKLMQVTQRTNYFQTAAGGSVKEYFSFKLRSGLVEEVPRPRPEYEIFVFSPAFEGVHLRGGKVARGGLRWSDRREDFRTEVLGLVKAQQVKNSIIVPVGAKGGFVVKTASTGLSREAVREQGIACYRSFVRGLLDITDNIVAGAVVPPAQVVRRDEDDTYLVVAADKGTAAFSDIANGIAREYDFWLGDGFASGGSNGYDHKKMGITARGAWISVQRHFRELGIDVQKQDFTVAGIGDMSGDVFGNGLLQSPHIRLVAAFNHLHLFIDPNPDRQLSFRERRRLFRLPTSAWSDYNVKLISRGGGVFSRSAKVITVSAEMRKRFGIEEDRLAPDRLISAILKSQVDLLWNGGIGTYVKAAHETHADTGDKANDTLRVNGGDLRCKVVAEGGNLGFTQAGRIEYALQGGTSLTDFIDNSAGVDCSDHEVNIKILLNELFARGELKTEARSKLLTGMTEEVARLVLRNNYKQVQSIGIAFSQAKSNFAEYIDLLEFLETHAGLDRKLENFSTEEELEERRTEGLGLTRPELAILTSYMKMYLKAQLVNASYIEDDYLLPCLYSAFPAMLVSEFKPALHKHRLRKEIVATQLANEVVNLAGPSFIYRKVEYTGATVNDVVKAAVIARNLFGIDAVVNQVEALDYRVSAAAQNEMMLKLMQLMRRVTRWLLRNRRSQLDLAGTTGEFSKAIEISFGLLPEALPEKARDRWRLRFDHYLNESVPRELAHSMACVEFVFPLLAITEISSGSNIGPRMALEAFYAVGDALQLATLRQAIIDLKVDNQWQALARKAFQDDLDWQQRALTQNVLRTVGKSGSVPAAVQAWCEQHRLLIARSQAMLRDLQRESSSDYSVFSVVLRELLNLAQNTASYH